MNILSYLISYCNYVLFGIITFGLLIFVIVLIKKNLKKTKTETSTISNKVKTKTDIIFEKIATKIGKVIWFIKRHKVVILTSLSSLSVVVLGFLTYHFKWHILVFNGIKTAISYGKIKIVYILDVYGDYILIGIIAFAFVFGLISLLRRLEIRIRIKKEGGKTSESLNRAKEKRIIRQFFHNHFGLFKTKKEIQDIARVKNLEIARKIKEKRLEEKQREERKLRKEEEKKQRKLVKENLKILHKKNRNEEQIKKQREELRVLIHKQKQENLEEKMKLEYKLEEERIKKKLEVQKEKKIKMRLKEKFKKR